jgi:hypothetical protein
MMADIVDRAEQDASLYLAEAIRKIRSRQPELDPKGACHFCEEAVGPEKKFCDRDCATDYAREQAALVRRGKG